MHEIGTLPPEILHIVLLLVLNQDPSLPLPLPSENENQGLRDLCACCLVNSTWLGQGRPLLYSKFRHKSDEDSFGTLWCFLRTVVEKPEIGALVRHLDLRKDDYSYKHGKETNPRKERTIRQDNRALVAAGARTGTRSLAKAIHLRDAAPLIATLTASLPTVSKLYLSTEYLFDNGRCSIDQSFMQCLEKNGALHHIRDVMLLDTDTLNTYETRQDRSKYKAGIDILYRQPSLKTLSLFTLNTCSVPAISEEFPAHTSHITHLTITCNTPCVVNFDRHYSIPAARSGLRACLLLPRALVSLTVGIGYFKGYRPYIFPYHNLISHSDLWQILQHHIQNLQYLDLYDRDCGHGFLRSHFAPDALDKLDKFDRLTTLRIQPHILIGDINGPPKVSYRLRDALPRFLRSLTLYDIRINASTGDGGLLTELFEILDQTFIADNLKYLVIDTTDNGYLQSLEEGDELFEKMEALRQACKDRDIVFHIRDHWQLPRGGFNLVQYPEAYDIESKL